MNRQISLLILVFWTSSFAFSQDFYFRWQFCPSLSKAYTVKIEKKNSENCIIIKGTYSNDSIVKKISDADCNLLEGFLDKYDFPNIIIEYNGNIARNYYDTKLLSDTNWIMINFDSLRKENIGILGYKYDNIKNKYYKEIQRNVISTDGHTYEGEYIKSDIKRKYIIYSTNVSKLDCELNKIVYSFMVKYDSRNKYSRVKRYIDMDESIK